MKPRKTSLTDEMARIDNSTNWGKVADIIEQQHLYKIEVIEDLLSKISSLNNLTHTKIKERFIIQLLEDNTQSEVRAETDIKETFLKELESKDIIQNLKIEVSTNEDDYVMPTEVVRASFSYTPITAKEALEDLKDQLLEEERVKVENRKKPKLYITQRGEDYYYKGLFLEVGADTQYRKVFDSLFHLIKNGGFVDYLTLGKDVKERIPAMRGASEKEMRDFIRENLLNHNGFLHRAKIKGKHIPTTISGGKPLIKVIKGKGIEFNNEMGA